MRWSVCVVVVAVGLAGCVSEEESVEYAELGCGPNCPGNSPILGPLGPYEFRIDGGGYSSRRWKLHPGSFRRVTNEPIVDVGVSDTGAGLTGRYWNPYAGMWIDMTPSDWWMATWTMNHQTWGNYEFRIVGYTPVYYYTNPPPVPLPPLWAYKVEYRDPADSSASWEGLCPYTEYQPDSGLSLDWTVFWKGNRYDPITGLFTHFGPTEVESWVNMSCAGAADIKVLRAGHGYPVNPGASRKKTQAVLNMMMAKYCPTEERYTLLGEKIFWTGTIPKTTGINGLHEAIWDENGAQCLDTPRVPTVSADSIACDLSPCNAKNSYWQEDGLLSTWNPLVIVVEPPQPPPVILPP